MFLTPADERCRLLMDRFGFREAVTKPYTPLEKFKGESAAAGKRKAQLKRAGQLDCSESTRHESAICSQC